MPTLERHIERGNNAIAAAEVNPTDAFTQAMDAITEVMHAGYANALKEVRDGHSAAGTIAEGGTDFMTSATTPEEFLREVFLSVELHFTAEQAGDL